MPQKFPFQINYKYCFLDLEMWILASFLVDTLNYIYRSQLLIYGDTDLIQTVVVRKIFNSEISQNKKWTDFSTAN